MAEVLPGRPKVSTGKKNTKTFIKYQEKKLVTTTTNMAFAQVVDLEYRAISRRCQEGDSFEKNL